MAPGLEKGHLVLCENSGSVNSFHAPHTEREISCFKHRITLGLEEEEHLKNDSKPRQR